MEKAKVYFTDMRTNNRTALTDKLKKLLKVAGIGDIDFDQRFVCIKMHFGETGNLSTLRPQYVKVVADAIKEKGGIPFLADCNTLYVGTRKHAIEHLDTAALNGYTYETTGCRILIADGLRGTDDVSVPVVGGELVKEAKIGRAIMDADIFISLTHFKGHEMTGFGGAVKNIGMGSGSRAGKMEQHANGKPYVVTERCRGCHLCATACANSAITFTNGKASVDHSKCVGCGRCIGMCTVSAMQPCWDISNEDLCKKMAEYAKAVVDGRPCFHITVMTDMSPYCDCIANNDVPILPNLGMAASLDPVALDQACIDMCRAAQPAKGSILADKMAAGKWNYDAFTTVHPTTRGDATLEHSEKIGLGTREYELITVK